MGERISSARPDTEVCSRDSVRPAHAHNMEIVMVDSVDSASDDRTVNNVMRHTYRVLTDAEKASMQAIKDKGLELHAMFEQLGNSREISIAKTKAEEAVMWAVKHLTK